jgi:hypothetical protein
LYDATEWSTRWVWPFELYAPVFEAAKANGSPLVALNPATEAGHGMDMAGYGYTLHDLMRDNTYTLNKYQHNISIYILHLQYQHNIII